MTKTFTTYLQLAAVATLGVVALSGCSDFNQAIGKEKSVPDEFEVVVRPPLSLPPGFAARPDETDSTPQAVVSNTIISAKAQTSALLGSRDGSAIGYDDLFAFDSVPANIRNLVDEETAGIRFERRLPIQIVFGGLPDVGPILNQMEEDVRLRSNRLQGKAPTDGASKAIDGVDGAEVLVQ